MLEAYRAGQGFKGTDEYAPIGADNSLLATGLPQACLVSDPDDRAGQEHGRRTRPPTGTPRKAVARPRIRQPTGGKAAARASAHRGRRCPTPATWFCACAAIRPGSVKVNGQPVADLPQRDDGLIAVPVPQGPVDLTVDWTTTADVIAGRWLSALGVLLLTGLCLLERRLCSRARLS